MPDKKPLRFSLEAEQIRGAAASATKGQAFVYHLGNLAKDCGGCLEANASASERAARAARSEAWAAYEAGHVTLTQRRVDASRCEYIATGR